MRLTTLFSLLLLFSVASCTDSTDSGEEPEPTDPSSYQAAIAFPELSFNQPVDLQNPGDESDRLFVVEQRGVIKVFQNDASTAEASTFLDITDQITDGDERGLLGLAFHPDYQSNGYFYVNYTTGDLRTIVSRFEVDSSNPNQAVEESEVELLSFEQPFENHNGGQLQFGPDGYLYIATGDGGSGGDPRGNAQDLSTLRGNILRIDVDGTEDGKNYAIPSDNPFFDNTDGFREEIFAYGLRNPWRFSFDAQEGTLWAGDVGQGQYEEIDIIRAGENYGWNIMEGSSCYESNNCDRSPLTLPVIDYGRNQGQSVTGGYVYRGQRLEGLIGWYLYADFISGQIWALNAANPDQPENIDLLSTDLRISSFGVDGANELYICALDGSIYHLVKTGS
jgi:glucose/arabinose dehydrogenase